MYFIGVLFLFYFKQIVVPFYSIRTRLVSICPVPRPGRARFITPGPLAVGFQRPVHTASCS